MGFWVVDKQTKKGEVLFERVGACILIAHAMEHFRSWLVHSVLLIIMMDFSSAGYTWGTIFSFLHMNQEVHKTELPAKLGRIEQCYI